MRILIATAVAVLFTSSFAFAQARTQSVKPAKSASTSKTTYTYKPAQREELMLSPLLGVTFNSISGDFEASSDTGFNAGLAVEYGLGTTVFYSGLIYTQLNSSRTQAVELLNTNITLDVTQDYLVIPLQAKTRFDNGGFEPYLRYGLTANVVLDAKAKVLGQTFNFKKDVRGLHIGGTFAAGVVIPFDSTDLNVDISINRSLQSISSDSADVINQTIMLNGSVML
ncbi:MAG: outer membrane beta-barrel protein [Bdellovibrionales bacterium]|nr:outer membrane beta-barrel protein [Bdellovibrionales bacterium]